MKCNIWGIALLALGIAAISCEKDPGPLTLATTDGIIPSYVIRQGENLTIDFQINATEGNLLEAEVSTSNEAFTATVAMDETASGAGSIVVTAPQYVFSETPFVVTLSLLDPATTRDLSVEFPVTALLADNFLEITNPANCYIVAPGSLVKFPANYGCESEKVTFASASLLWQDAKSLVKMVSCDPELGVVYADITPDMSGNAVVALADATGATVWSYNLWITNYDPSADVMVYTDANGKKFEFMDRHLGALTNEPGTDAAHGNFYQWGRKDAFAGSNHEGTLKEMYDIEGNVVERTLTACDAEDNVPNGIANPLTHYSGVSGGNYNWVTNSKAAFQEKMLDLWGGESNTKTRHDPCPNGWRVPEIEAWAFMTTFTCEKVFIAESANANKDLLGKYWSNPEGGNKYFVPAQGELAHGSLKVGSSTGTSWPCSKTWSCDADSQYYRVFSTGVSPSSNSAKMGISSGYELPVRCVKY